MNVHGEEQWGIIQKMFIARIKSRSWKGGRSSLFYYTTTISLFLCAIMSMNAKEWEWNQKHWRRKISSNNNYLWAFACYWHSAVVVLDFFVGAVHAYFFKYLHSTMNSWHKILSFAVKHDVLWQQTRWKIKIKHEMILCYWLGALTNEGNFQRIFFSQWDTCVHSSEH